MTYPEPQTEMASAPPLLDQDAAWDAVRRVGPKIEQRGEAGLWLRSGGHMLDFAEPTAPNDDCRASVELSPATPRG